MASTWRAFFIRDAVTIAAMPVSGAIAEQRYRVQKDYRVADLLILPPATSQLDPSARART